MYALKGLCSHCIIISASLPYFTVAPRVVLVRSSLATGRIFGKGISFSIFFLKRSHRAAVADIKANTKSTQQYGRENSVSQTKRNRTLHTHTYSAHTCTWPPRGLSARRGKWNKDEKHTHRSSFHQHSFRGNKNTRTYDRSYDNSYTVHQADFSFQIHSCCSGGRIGRRGTPDFHLFLFLPLGLHFS